MINPDTIAVDIEEQREWLLNYKLSKSFSWRVIAPLIGLAQGTISAFGSNNYNGNQQVIAEAIFRYRQTLESQETRETGIIRSPGYFETRTSARISGLLTMAQGGRITVAGMSPGTGKTMTAQEYAASASNVWFVTMLKSVKTVNAVTMLVLREMGIMTRGGWGAQLSSVVIDRMRGRRGLLIIDEANHLSLEQFEEIRGWHDASGCGVCFLGNEELMLRIEAGQRSDAFARLHSRIASSHVQTLPLEDDVHAFCDAWGIEDGAMRELLKRIALTPAAGGLRECAQIVEQASMIAADESRPMSFADLKEAKATRATRHIK
jgi:DNA transposition AAA+ family ATPase